MYTPGHAVVNLALLGAASGAWAGPRFALPIVAGAVLPDLPIAALWAYERLRGTPEEIIWRERYRSRRWLAAIHGAHSIPVAAMGLALALGAAFPEAAALFASMLLHALGDLPVHGEDAHRHLFPLSGWRFISPLSYWDARRYAREVSLVEACLVAAAAASLWPSVDRVPAAVLVAVVVWYAAAWVRRFVIARPRVPVRAR